MRDGKLLVVLAVIVTFGLNLVLMVYCFWVVRQNRVTVPVLRSEIEGQLGIAITNIVDRIMHDVGMRPSPALGSPSSSSRSLEFVSAEIKTFDDMAFINGKVFREGDFIAPYGMVMSIGKDCVALAMPNNDKSYLIAPPLPELRQERQGSEEGRGTNLAAPAAASSPAPAPAPAASPSKG